MVDILNSENADIADTRGLRGRHRPFDMPQSELAFDYFMKARNARIQLVGQSSVANRLVAELL